MNFEKFRSKTFKKFSNSEVEDYDNRLLSLMVEIKKTQKYKSLDGLSRLHLLEYCAVSLIALQYMKSDMISNYDSVFVTDLVSSRGYNRLKKLRETAFKLMTEANSLRLENADERKEFKMEVSGQEQDDFKR